MKGLYPSTALSNVISGSWFLEVSEDGDSRYQKC
ncbi:hypothetical protein SAI_0385 [Streptococcus agalactiae H36B]|nr:hypothetical protein SAI_0385 [Streptococcus agalactiae H36B]